MIGLDTNVVIRILVDDDPIQSGAVKKLLAAHDNTVGAFFVNDIVLAESAWVLASAYRQSREAIAAAIQALLDTPAFAVENTGAVAQALKHFKTTNADFSDCLLVARNAARHCVQTVTFDRKMQELPSVKLL